MASKISQEDPLLLASGSPRRREILTRIGLPVRVRPVDVDELARPGEGANAYLERIVDAKAAAAERLRIDDGASAALVADTIVLIDDEILGKPVDDAHATAMLTQLAGRAHVVATRFALLTDGAPVVETVRTAVWFRALTPAHIERYVATGEGADKAGAYAIQGIGAMLVEKVDGDYECVVGLPVCRVVIAMERLGIVTGCPSC